MKEQDKRKTTKEIEKVDITEIEHQTEHPGTTEFSLQQDTFVPGENNYLNENNQSRGEV